MWMWMRMHLQEITNHLLINSCVSIWRKPNICSAHTYTHTYRHTRTHSHSQSHTLEDTEKEKAIACQGNCSQQLTRQRICLASGWKLRTKILTYNMQMRMQHKLNLPYTPTHTHVYIYCICTTYVCVAKRMKKHVFLRFIAMENGSKAVTSVYPVKCVARKVCHLSFHI